MEFDFLSPHVTKKRNALLPEKDHGEAKGSLYHGQRERESGLEHNAHYTTAKSKMRMKA